MIISRNHISLGNQEKELNDYFEKTSQKTPK
jgi:hypothetical protein